MKDSEHPGKTVQYSPAGEVVFFIGDIGGVVKYEGVAWIEFTDQLFDLIAAPVHAEIPAADHQGSIGEFFPQFTDDPAVGIKLHLMIFAVIFEAEPFGKSDGVEQGRRTVVFDTLHRNFEVVVQIFILAYIPDQTGFLIVSCGRLRNEPGIDMLEEVKRSTAVPVGERADIFRIQEIPFPGVSQDLAAQFSTIFKRPEQIPVIV